MKIMPDVVRQQIVCSVDGGAMAAEAARLMAERNISAILVIDRGRLQGIVTERDLARKCCAIGADAERTPVSAIMTEAPDTIRPDDDARGALELMELRGYRHLPVVDGETVVGIVSIRDLHGAVRQQLERLTALSQDLLLGNRYSALGDDLNG